MVDLWDHYKVNASSNCRDTNFDFSVYNSNPEVFMEIKVGYSSNF